MTVVFPSPIYETAHNQLHSTYLGQRQLGKKELLSSSPAVPTIFVLVKP